MEYIQFSLTMLAVFFIYTVIIGIYMKITNYIGGMLGIGKLFVNLMRKIIRAAKKA